MPLGGNVDNGGRGRNDRAPKSGGRLALFSGKLRSSWIQLTYGAWFLLLEYRQDTTGWLDDARAYLIEPQGMTLQPPPI